MTHGATAADSQRAAPSAGVTARGANGAAEPGGRRRHHPRPCPLAAGGPGGRTPPPRPSNPKQSRRLARRAARPPIPAPAPPGGGSPAARPRPPVGRGERRARAFRRRGGRGAGEAQAPVPPGRPPAQRRAHRPTPPRSPAAGPGPAAGGLPPHPPAAAGLPSAFHVKIRSRRPQAAPQPAGPAAAPAAPARGEAEGGRIPEASAGAPRPLTGSSSPSPRRSGVVGSAENGGDTLLESKRGSCELF